MRSKNIEIWVKSFKNAIVDAESSQYSVSLEDYAFLPKASVEKVRSNIKNGDIKLNKSSRKKFANWRNIVIGK